jgi:APA family basic amino acid/polyamine antiporter
MIAIGVGAIIGSGIYSLAGIAAGGVQYPIPSAMGQPVAKVIWQLLHGVLPASGYHNSPPAGPGVVVAFLVVALVCLLIGLCYAELASLMPLAGSVYTYSYAALGELPAWIMGWILVLEYGLGNVVFATALGQAVKERLADFHLYVPGHWSMPVWSEGKWTGAYFNLPAFLLVLAVTLILSRGIRAFSRTNMVLVILKCSAILFFLLLGSTFARPANWHPFAPGGAGGVLAAGIILFYVYIGFDCVSVAAEETKRPQRDVPAGILGSLAICATLYIGMAVVLLGMIPYTHFGSGAPASQMPVLYALQQFGVRPVSQGLIVTGMLVGMLSVMFVLQYGQTRLWYVMSRDGLVPAIFSSIHARTRSPHLSVWIWGTTVAVCAGVIDIGEAADLVTIGSLIAFAVASICVMILRKTQPSRPRPFKVPWSPWLPWASLAAMLALMLCLPVITWVRLFVWLAIGLAIYFGYSRRHSTLTTP